MKNKRLCTLVMLGKVSVYGFVLAAWLLNALMANESRVQRVQSVKEARIHLSLKEVSLEETLRRIEKKSAYTFVYNQEVFLADQKFSIPGRDRTVASLLLEISQKAKVSFRQVNNRISVRKNKEDDDQSRRIEVIIDEVEVSGKVMDENGEPLPGATILVQGTTNGTVTDIEGAFRLHVTEPNQSILVVSFVGYYPQQIRLDGQTQLSVSLLPDLTSLEEVVVVGYGSVKKQDLTGAVASIGNEDLVKVGSVSPLGALQTNAAGVNITPKTGTVGSGFDITIRGVNTLSSGTGDLVQSGPLFVVDGVFTDNIDFLNPMDIQRIDVLKDASSTAIYGSRGSKGVVIVTTNAGTGVKIGRPSFSYSGYVGVRTVANMPDFLNTYDESVQWNRDRQMARDLVQGNTIQPSSLYGFPYVATDNGYSYWGEALANRRGTDWVGEFLKPSIQQNHFVSASGNSNQLSYVVGFGYQGDDGNVEGQYYKKYNFKASLDARPMELFSIGSNVSIAFSERELISRQGYTRQLFRMPAYAPATDEDGEIVQSPMLGISSNVNPYAFLVSGSEYNVEEINILSNFYLTFSPVDFLTFRSTFSPSGRIQRSGEYFDRFATRSISVARMWNSNKLSYVWDNQASFNKAFGAHEIAYDFIQSAYFERLESAFAYGRDVPFASLYYNVQSAPQRDASTGFSKRTLMSFTNRVNYTFQDKYLLTATLRWDGSSVLAAGRQWAYFPSAAIAWKIADEPFLSAVPQINQLKLRVSYGVSGNDKVAPYASQAPLENQTYYDWDGSTADGFIPSRLSNKDLTWEKTREWNLGIDFGFFQNRITGELNVYDRLSRDIIMSRKLPMPTGWDRMLDNIGTVSNKGIELSLTTVNVATQDFEWRTNFMFTKNTNKIVELYGQKEDDVVNRWFIGQPVSVVYAMVFDGVWQATDTYVDETERQQLEGTAKVKDLNDDGTIDINNDMMVLGSPVPDWIGTFSTTFNYKNWDLSATVYTKQGILQYSPFHREFLDFNSKVILDVPYYKRDNPISGPRYTNEYPQPSYMGQYYGEDAEEYGYPGYNVDASFVRIQNITLGYDFKSALLTRLKVRSLRLYVNAMNPFVFTDYVGFDPEWAGAGMSGVDATNTSFSVYQLGANIKF